MKGKKYGRGRIANKQSINLNKIGKNKDASMVFLSHKVIKFRLSTAQISRKQYNKILKIFKDFGILNYSTRGVRFKKMKENV